MSQGRWGKATNWGEDAHGAKILDQQHNVWGEIPGQIVSFDAGAQTATIKPLYKPQFDGETFEMPELLEVPVRFDRGGNGGITYPIAAGDRVVLRPQMRDSEKYHTEDDFEALDARSFNASDYEAFVQGGEPLTDPIAGFDAGNTHLRWDPAGEYGLRGSVDGKMSLIGNSGNAYELVTEVVELLGTEPALIHAPRYAEIGALLRAMVL